MKGIYASWISYFGSFAGTHHGESLDSLYPLNFFFLFSLNSLLTASLGHLERGFVVIIGRHSGFGRDGSSRVIDMIEARSIETTLEECGRRKVHRLG